jgi:phosphatidylserine/phosphatidylglycerophosphate/cardiolipin synthase-like enzyme
VVADRGFYDTYPGALDALAAEGIAVGLIDYRAIAGGPMHAKYFVIDGEVAVVGSQNTDWRALEHIFEMGLEIRDASLAAEFARVFDSDWRRSEGLPGGDRPGADAPAPPERREFPRVRVTPSEGSAPPETVSVRPAFSPAGDLPFAEDWDLPQILDLIGGARDTVRVTFLSYTLRGRDGSCG